MLQQIVTFEELFDHIKDDGVHLCEDCHTSYFKSYGGGLRRKGTFIEYSKKLIDKLTAWHYKNDIEEFTKTVKSICFYDSIVVIEKEIMEAPESLKVGEASFEECTFTDGKSASFTDKLFRRLQLR